MTAQFATSKFCRNFALSIAVLFMACTSAIAQPGGGGGGGFDDGDNTFLRFRTVVGGVSINPNGVLTESHEFSAELRQQLMNGLNAAHSDINQQSNMRVISLRGLEEAMSEIAKSGKPFPAEIQFMAGLQRIEFVMLAPEGDDILVAGYGEGWKVDNDGNVVGVSTGMPVIHLQDFLVAMRNVKEARVGQGISVSIDPTEAGIRKLNQLYQTTRVTPDMQGVIEQTVGPQQITLTGVPKNSRFSQVLVAADYKMKRLSMGLEDSPVKNLPSVIEMARRKNANFKGSSPRFWMECNYQPVATNNDNTVFQIRGQGVKALTEDSFFNKDGQSVRRKGKTNKFAKQWADQMTKRYDELSKEEPIFRDLRNIMDLSVVAALISRENLLERASLEIPAIQSKESYVSVPAVNVPKSVPSQCGFVKFRNSWVVSVSGGVQVDSWAVASNLQTVANVAEAQENAAKRTTNRWWWNSTN